MLDAVIYGDVKQWKIVLYRKSRGMSSVCRRIGAFCLPIDLKDETPDLNQPLALREFFFGFGFGLLRHFHLARGHSVLLV